MLYSQVLSVFKGGSYVRVCIVRVYFRFLSTKPGKLALLDFYILLNRGLKNQQNKYDSV